MLPGLFAPLTLAALTLMGSISGRPSEPPTRNAVRFVDVRGAAALVARGAAVLDARDPAGYANGHLPGAQPYAWQAFTGQGAARGQLRSDRHALARALAALGVDANRPTLIYGATDKGAGEEGHAAWLLSFLGHTDIAILDGGFAAWRMAGRPVVASAAPPRVGTFEPKIRPEMRAARDEVARAKQLLDVRTAYEFGGATPCGEMRGGHIPTSRHLDWRTLLDETGRVRSLARVLRSLADAGVDPEREIVVCCTSGVRSAFVAAVLQSRGMVGVRVYDGGMIEWSADASAPLAR